MSDLHRWCVNFTKCGKLFKRKVVYRSYPPPSPTRTPGFNAVKFGAICGRKYGVCDTLPCFYLLSHHNFFLLYWHYHSRVCVLGSLRSPTFGIKMYWYHHLHKGLISKFHKCSNSKTLLLPYRFHAVLACRINPHALSRNFINVLIPKHLYYLIILV